MNQPSFRYNPPPTEPDCELCNKGKAEARLEKQLVFGTTVIGRKPYLVCGKCRDTLLTESGHEELLNQEMS